MGCAAAGARWGDEILVGDVQAALEGAKKQPALSTALVNLAAQWVYSSP